jgi:hypothetical protein
MKRAVWTIIILLTCWTLTHCQSFYRWRPDTNVPVYFMPGFSPEQRAAAFRGMRLWNVANIAFTEAGNTSEVMKCENCLTLTRAVSSNPSELAHLTAWPIINTQFIGCAVIELDPRTQALDAIESFVGHETGHSLGLPDVNSGKSIMGHFDHGLNRPGPRITEADILAARRNY